MKQPRPVRDAIGLRVRTVRPLTNGYATIAEGTVCLVTDARNGITIETAACPTCCVRVHMRKVSYADVDIVDRDEAATVERANMRRRRSR